jgi:hypothetical protein
MIMLNNGGLFTNLEGVLHEKCRTTLLAFRVLA